jgi:hypothetical protein
MEVLSGLPDQSDFQARPRGLVLGHRLPEPNPLEDWNGDPLPPPMESALRLAPLQKVAFSLNLLLKVY